MTVGLELARLLASAFLAALFLHAGLSKVLDWKGSRAAAAARLAGAPFARWLGPLFFLLTAMEVVAGVTSAAGTLGLLTGQRSPLALVGAAVAGVTLWCIFLGLRLAKDEAGAAQVVPYLIAAVGTLLLVETP